MIYATSSRSDGIHLDYEWTVDKGVSLAYMLEFHYGVDITGISEIKADGKELDAILKRFYNTASGVLSIPWAYGVENNMRWFDTYARFIAANL